jgi:3',5'-cyclic AMP phosphodiesterase CpdA
LARERRVTAPRRALFFKSRSPPVIDPRDGDFEADASSPERRSLLAIARNLLVEVSLPKLAYALVLLIVFPAIILGLGPIVVTLWFHTLASSPGVYGGVALMLVVALLAFAWYSGRALLRVVEGAFWSLNSMAIQPGYVAWREAVLHVTGRFVGAGASERNRARMRAASAVVAGVLICALSVWVISLVWPSTRWTGELADLRNPYRLVWPALANATAIVAGYLAVAALVWGVADATLPHSQELTAFRPRADFVRSWRVAHLSDIHLVGERFGFRLGSGRAGPRGNHNFIEALRRLDEVHRREPLDAIVITGDLTDAGTSAEWAELLDAFDRFPGLAALTIAVPGNHDLNVVDRANPARLDLPTSPMKRLRQLRTISALASIQGSHMYVVDGERNDLEATVDEMLAPHASDVAAFADEGTRRLAKKTEATWTSAFPMIQRPRREDGLGIIALNSNAETHFSFTNALGLVSAEQAGALDAAMKAYPRACWIVALHHHVVEHPKLGHALAERVGTTLINGNWFTRRLLRVGDRAVVMHGHRHIDWMGRCGELAILSASSSTMPTTGHPDIHFYVHVVGVDAAGHIDIAQPECVSVLKTDPTTRSNQ